MSYEEDVRGVLRELINMELSYLLTAIRPSRGSLERLDRGLNVGQALVTGLALDAEGAGIADLVQGLQEALGIDLAGTKGDLLAPILARFFRTSGILHVDVLDELAEGFDGGDGLARTVEDHVGGVEVDGDVGALEVVEEFQQLLGAL